MRPKAKREVRREEEFSNPVDTGASTSNNPKMRVLNHKDYKTWKVRIPSVNTFSSITGFLSHCSYFGKTQRSQNTFLLLTRPNKPHMS